MNSQMTIVQPSLPAGVLEFLTTCPKTGGGVHRWLFSAALKLHRRLLGKETITQLLTSAVTNCGRIVTAQEINDAIVNSQRVLLAGENGTQAEPRTPKWPRPDHGQIEAIARGGGRLVDLAEMSPVKWGDGKPHTEEIIDTLFPGNPLLCIGQSKYYFDTMPREMWRGSLIGLQFIVPSPMTQVYGITKNGKKSKHTLDNTGPRRFLIIEFDEGTFDQHAAILMHLAKFAPLVMTVHSGSKSLHGWFYCAGQDEKTVRGFMRYAVSLGADPATWIKSQFVRLPDGQRDNGKRQAVMFFNTEPLRAT